MSHGIESARCGPEETRFAVEAAAKQFAVSVDELEDYAREGLLLSLASENGDRYYTASDERWVSTISRLLREARLSFAEIRQLLSCCPCWKIRHCDFRNKYSCPLNQAPSEPCWVNRAMCTVLSSYPCYFCIVYRSAPECENIQAMLGAPQPSMLSAYGYYGG